MLNVWRKSPRGAKEKEAYEKTAAAGSRKGKGGVLLKSFFLLCGVTQEREGRKKVDFSSFRWQRVKKW